MDNKITELEKLQIDFAALELQLAQSKAEIADLKHKNKVLMLFVKYKLDFKDYIDQNGNIKQQELNEENIQNK